MCIRDSHSLALTASGRLLAWGSDTNQQLGNGSFGSSTTPTAVGLAVAFPGERIVSLAAGSIHSLALGSGGHIYAWGSTASGQVGNNGFIDVANLVLSQYGDNFDFISVWTTFPDNNVAAYYFPLKQDTENLGDCNFNSGETFGCVFDQTGGQLERLQGLVFMNSISTWQEWDLSLIHISEPTRPY